MAQESAHGHDVAPLSRSGCIHHWNIESPNGTDSVGVCRRCGSKRRFSNSNESVQFERFSSIRNDTPRETPMRNDRAAKSVRDERVLAEES